MKDEKEILEIAHRTAWRYKKSNDPHHSDTYTFNEACMIDFARKVSERGAPCLNFCEAQAFKTEIRQLKAELEKTRGEAQAFKTEIRQLKAELEKTRGEILAIMKKASDSYTYYAKAPW